MGNHPKNTQFTIYFLPHAGLRVVFSHSQEYCLRLLCQNLTSWGKKNQNCVAVDLLTKWSSYALTALKKKQEQIIKTPTAEMRNLKYALWEACNVILSSLRDTCKPSDMASLRFKFLLLDMGRDNPSYSRSYIIGLTSKSLILMLSDDVLFHPSSSQQ